MRVIKDNCIPWNAVGAGRRVSAETTSPAGGPPLGGDIIQLVGTMVSGCSSWHRTKEIGTGAEFEVPAMLRSAASAIVVASYPDSVEMMFVYGITTLSLLYGRSNNNDGKHILGASGQGPWTPAPS